MPAPALPLRTKVRGVEPGFGDGRSEPPRERAGGGGGSGWVPLLRANHDIEAHLLIGRLAEAGVEATSLKDRHAPGAWLHGGSNPWAPATILVRRFQLEDARIVLAELAFAAPAVVPQAGAEGPRCWRGPLVWWAAAIGLGLLFTGLGLMQTANEVERCARSSCAGSSPTP